MSFPRYAEYKNGEMPWLEKVPAHWAAGPLKHVIASIESGTSVNAVDESVSDGQIGVLKTSCVYTGQFRAEENKRVVPEELDRVSCPLRSGTLIVSRMNTPDLVGAAGHVEEAPAGIFLPDRLWQVSLKEALPRFVHYWTQSELYRASVKSVCAGTSSSMQNLGQDQFRSFPFAVAPIAEQTIITVFLDRETGKIDALVAEQEKLIALLKEKRQAVISHAVTKGLNPDAPMKPSGIEWLGNVPALWKVTQVKRLTRLITDGAHISPETDGGEYDFVSTKDVGDDFIDFEGALKTTAASYEYLVRTGCRPEVGDVLFSKDGTIGRTVVVREAKNFVVASSLIIIRPEAEVLNPDFLSYLCQSDIVRQQVDGFVKGAGLPRLSIQNLLKVIGVFPPLREQHAISVYLDSVARQFGLLIMDANNTITLLKERRSALISAAVTGQIDVRNAVGLTVVREAANA